MLRRKKTPTERFVAEARDIASQVAGWLQDRLDEAPDPEELRETVSESTREAIETARDRIEDVASWLADMTDDISGRLSNSISDRIEPDDDDGSKVKTLAAIAGVGAAAWYFFEPSRGRERRRRFVEKAKEAWAQLTGSFQAGSSATD